MCEMLGKHQAYHQPSVSFVSYYRITLTIYCKIYYRKLFTGHCILYKYLAPYRKSLEQGTWRRKEEKGGQLRSSRLKRQVDIGRLKRNS